MWFWQEDGSGHGVGFRGNKEEEMEEKLQRKGYRGSLYNYSIVPTFGDRKFNRQSPRGAVTIRISKATCLGNG